MNQEILEKEMLRRRWKALKGICWDSKPAWISITPQYKDIWLAFIQSQFEEEQ